MRITAVMALMVGCAGGPQHGSFLSGQQDLQRALALDAACKIAGDYGDDGAAVVLMHPASDPFGQALSSQLRKHGFRVQRADVAQPGALRVSYVADSVKGTELLRVILQINGRLLSRAYRPRGGGVEPAGPWTATGGQS